MNEKQESKIQGNQQHCQKRQILKSQTFNVERNKMVEVAFDGSKLHLMNWSFIQRIEVAFDGSKSSLTSDLRFDFVEAIFDVSKSACSTSDTSLPLSKYSNVLIEACIIEVIQC